MRKSPRYLEKFSRSFKKTRKFPNLLSAETENIYLLYTLLSTINTISSRDPDMSKLVDVVGKLKACRKGQPCLCLLCKTCSRTQRLRIMQDNFSWANKLADSLSVLNLNFNSAAINPEDFNKDLLSSKIHKIDMQLKEWREIAGDNLLIGGVWGLSHYHFDNLVNKNVWVPQVRLILPNDEELHQELLSFMIESGEGNLHGIIENNPVNKLKVKTVNDALIAAYNPLWCECSCRVVTKAGRLMLNKSKESSLSNALIDGLFVQTQIDTSDIEILRKSGSIGRKSSFISDWDTE